MASELVEKARWQGSQAEGGANSHLITELADALEKAEAWKKIAFCIGELVLPEGSYDWKPDKLYDAIIARVRQSGKEWDEAQVTVAALSKKCDQLEQDREYNAGLVLEAQAQCAAMLAVCEAAWCWHHRYCNGIQEKSKDEAFLWNRLDTALEALYKYGLPSDAGRALLEELEQLRSVASAAESMLDAQDGAGTLAPPEKWFRLKEAVDGLREQAKE